MRGEEELAMVTISLPRGLEHHQGHELYYICVQAGSGHTHWVNNEQIIFQEFGSTKYIHQGHHKQIQIEMR